MLLDPTSGFIDRLFVPKRNFFSAAHTQSENKVKKSTKNQISLFFWICFATVEDVLCEYELGSGWRYRFLWWEVPLPGEGYLKLSTVLIFDVGVYLAVLGTLMTFVISLMESEE